jgi:uncharacterized membrane protein
MEQVSHTTQEARPPFRAVLTPYRSLGPKGFLILMAALSLVSFITGMAFYLSGAWPVLGFFGVDVALVYVAFKLNYRSGRQYETVEVGRERVTLTRVDAWGRAESHEFNPFFVRLRLDEGRDGRTALSLRTRERSLPFGHFLTDEERRDFAAALGTALSDARAMRL